MRSSITYENERFQLVSGCCIVDKNTDECIGWVSNGGIEWKQPDRETQRTVSAFIGECAMHGVTFAVSAGKTILCVLALAVLFLASGCNAVKTLAEGISEKSLSGSGTVSIQRVGVDPETNTPVLKSTVITGDYASARSGDHALQYRRKKSPSIFNKDAVTEETTINFIGTKEQAAAALDLAKQDATAAVASPGLEKPEAATATTTATPTTSVSITPEAK